MTSGRDSQASSANLQRPGWPGLPHDDSSPVFREPWEAQAFGLVVELHRHGAFTWKEWAEALSAQIRVAQTGGDPDLGNTYYRHWLTALEALIQSKGLTSATELAEFHRAWDRAADRTPHGQAIELSPADFGR